MKSYIIKALAKVIFWIGFVIGIVIGFMGNWSGWLGLSYSFNTTGMFITWGIFAGIWLMLLVWASVLENQEIQIQNQNQSIQTPVQQSTNNESNNENAFCAKCGKKMYNSASFCTKCGNAVIK
jgi:uncharacterized membrane protein YciS (DUF1049 family)